MALSAIIQAIRHGARQKQACAILCISSRTLQHWRKQGLNDKRQTVVKVPTNKLSKQERGAVLATCNSEEFKNKSPQQIVPILADQGIYIASESSFYRILRDADQLHHRGRTAAPKATAKPEPYLATAPNQVWSSPEKGVKSTVDLPLMHGRISSCQDHYAYNIQVLGIT